MQISLTHPRTKRRPTIYTKAFFDLLLQEKLYWQKSGHFGQSGHRNFVLLSSFQLFDAGAGEAVEPDEEPDERYTNHCGDKAGKVVVHHQKTVEHSMGGNGGQQHHGTKL